MGIHQKTNKKLTQKEIFRATNSNPHTRIRHVLLIYFCGVIFDICLGLKVTLSCTFHNIFFIIFSYRPMTELEISAHTETLSLLLLSD